MKLLLFILIVTPSCSLGQLNTVLHFVDQYSKEPIELTSDLYIEKATFLVDTVNNSVQLDRLRVNELVIHLAGYNNYKADVKRKSIADDTLKLFLVPNDSLCQMRYEAIWINKSLVNDTIALTSVQSLQARVKGITEYLRLKELQCDNGLCSFSNTYYYQFTFLRENGLYSLESVERIRHSGYDCDYLDEQLPKAKNVLPRYVIEAEQTEPKAKLRFSLIFTFY